MRDINIALVEARRAIDLFIAASRCNFCHFPVLLHPSARARTRTCATEYSAGRYVESRIGSNRFVSSRARAPTITFIDERTPEAFSDERSRVPGLHRSLKKELSARSRSPTFVKRQNDYCESPKRHRTSLQCSTNQNAYN